MVHHLAHLGTAPISPRQWRGAASRVSARDSGTRRQADPSVLDDHGTGRVEGLLDPAAGDGDGAGQVVGQLMITYEWSDWRNGVFWWIQSVFIREDCRRKGIFSALHRHVEMLARSAGDVCGIRLYVERENRRAQKTYEVLGMSSPGDQGMEIDFRKGQ